MAQINIYSPTNSGRVAVEYDRVVGEVAIGVEGELVDGAPETPPTWKSSGLLVVLDRDGCNHLIRAVREARDKAYGRDE